MVEIPEGVEAWDGAPGVMEGRPGPRRLDMEMRPDQTEGGDDGKEKG